MSNQVTGLQLFNANEMQAQTAALDSKGPYAGGLYKVNVFTPKHHLTNDAKGESNFAGSGYAIYATIIGMNATQSATAFPHSTAGTDLKITEYKQENGAMVESAHVEYKGVQVVKRTTTEATMPIEGNASLPYVSFQFTYTEGTYSEVGGNSYHLTPNHGAAPAGIYGGF